jgi:hypothetical protein
MPINPQTDYVAAQLNSAFVAVSAMSNITPTAIYLVNTTTLQFTNKLLSFLPNSSDITSITTSTVGSFQVFSFVVSKAVTSLDGHTQLSFNPIYVKATSLDAIPSTISASYLSPICYITNNTTTSFQINVSGMTLAGTSVLPTAVAIEVY